MMGKLYEALRLANVPEDKAPKIFATSRLLVWMAAFDLALTFLTALKVFSQ